MAVVKPQPGPARRPGDGHFSSPVPDCFPEPDCGGSRTTGRSRTTARSWTMPSLRQGAGLRPKPNYGSDSGCGPEPDFGPKLICGPVVAAGGRGPWLDPLWCRSLDHRPPRRCPGSKGCMRSLCPAFACAVPAGCYPDGCGVGVVPVGRRRIDPQGLRVLDFSLEPS